MASYIPYTARVPQKCIRLSKFPLLWSIVQRFKERQPLLNRTVFNIQHQLGDMTAQTEALIELGARPQDLYFLPPLYFNHRDFESFVMKHYGIPRENLFNSNTYRLRYDYDRYRLLHVIKHIKQMIDMEKYKANHLLVLDDGGCFPEALATINYLLNEKICIDSLTKHLPESLQMYSSDFLTIRSYCRSIRIALVEQTSRGIFKYQDYPTISSVLKELNIGIVDVASSEPKKRLEPPIIAEACLNMLFYLFTDAPSYQRIPKPMKHQRCLLLGYGAIGQAIGYALTHKGELGMFSHDKIRVWDRENDKQLAARNDGFQLWNQDDPNETFDYVIGCAGRCSLSVKSLHVLNDGAYLISASSAAIEFPFHVLVDTVLSDQQVKELEEGTIHRNVIFPIGNHKHVTIVNGGMPITFIGLLNPAKPEKFDLTLSCMVAASIQAVQDQDQAIGKNRLIPLKSEYVKMICQFFDQQENKS